MGKVWHCQEGVRSRIDGQLARTLPYPLSLKHDSAVPVHFSLSYATDL